MEAIYGVLVAWLMSSTALGVGASTIAITGFLAAIWDGNFEPGERRIMGVVYWTLRAAMIMIFFNALMLAILFPGSIASIYYLLFLVAALTFNSWLMTKHYISMKIAPAFQAATWYTVGFLLAIDGFSLLTINLKSFSILYIADIIFFIVVLNVLLKFIPKKKV